ncbi:MAG: 50S ribosomal protein L23 [Planctomycetota bacterium]
MLDSTHVLKKPLVTEKTTMGMNEDNRFSFLIDRRATKTDVKRAVEQVYGVRVTGVQTQVRKGKERRMRYGWVSEKVSKTATVRLHPDDTIELF